MRGDLMRGILRSVVIEAASSFCPLSRHFHSLSLSLLLREASGGVGNRPERSRAVKSGHELRRIAETRPHRGRNLRRDKWTVPRHLSVEQESLVCWVLSCLVRYFYSVSHRAPPYDIIKRVWKLLLFGWPNRIKSDWTVWEQLCTNARQESF